MRPHALPDKPPTAGEQVSEDGGDAPETVPVAFRPEPPVVAPEPVVALTKATVRLVLDGPMWVRAFRASDTLTIDRSGVLVPEADAEALVASAAKAGASVKVG